MLLDPEDSGIFPDDIISEILSRLPAKIIHRFECVSKRWNSIICNPNFITAYIAKSSLKWAILDRSIRVDPELETEFKLPLKQIPNVSTLSLNPTKLTDDSKEVFVKDHRIPVVLLTSSNGLILFSINIKRIFEGETTTSSFRVTEDDIFYVVNPITHEWVRIPKPPGFVPSFGSVGFITELGPTGVLERFLIVEYKPIIGSKYANLMCFWLETGKWDEISANYMLGRHMWNGDGVVEFDGHLIWVDWSAGILTWDKPFHNAKNNEKKVRIRFIELPRVSLMSEARRCVDVGGGHIQYLEVFKGGNIDLCLWRLKDYQSGEWSLVHKLCLKHVWLDSSYFGNGLDKALPQTQFIHPYEADKVVFMVGNRVFCLNLETRKVECAGTAYSFLNELTFISPFKLPSWPTSLSPSFKATLLKEQGNEFFKAKNFNEAISCYSSSIVLSPNAVAYANRAVAYLNTNRYHEAEADCTEALKLDNEYFKVYWRRAMARKELGDLKGCFGDVEFALKLKSDDQKLKKLYAEEANSSGPMTTAPPIQNDAGKLF